MYLTCGLQFTEGYKGFCTVPVVYLSNDLSCYYNPTIYCLILPSRKYAIRFMYVCVCYEKFSFVGIYFAKTYLQKS